MKKLLILVAVVSTIIPITFVVNKAGGLYEWRGVVPRGTTDSLYYYARIKEVLDGHLLNGNPYIYEYRDAFPPAFFLPDIVSAIPMLLGIPFDLGIAVNVLIWSLVFLLLASTLLRLLDLNERWAAIGSVLAYAVSYSFMLRPTIMQIVFPMFLLFLVALIKFLREPEKRSRVVWLAAASTSTFYIYTYLSYIILFSLVSVFSWFLFKKRFQEVRALLEVALWSGLMLIPFGLYTFMQMNDPYYLETLGRIGLVYARLPSAEAFLYGRWVLVGLAGAAFLSKQKIFWFSTGLSLLVASFLNVLTGAELALGVHIGRFIVLWMAMILAALLYDFYYSRMFKENKAKYALAIALLLVLSVGVVRNIPRGFDFFKFDERGSYPLARLQNLSGPFEWLEENVPEESVVWGNDTISQYLPIMTRHYPLFSNSAVLHSASTRELEERYLVSRSLGVLTEQEIKRDAGLYAGEFSDGLRASGDEYFKALKKRFDEIKETQAELLQRFHAKYLIIDLLHDRPGSISLERALYDDGRFVILPLPLK
jgi:hypothetical protein